jgi:hypothetical protein
LLFFRHHRELVVPYSKSLFTGVLTIPILAPYAYPELFVGHLTLVATALFFHVVSRPQVALNLAAQVTCDLAVRRRTPSLLPPTAVVAGSSTRSLLSRYISILFLLPAKLAINYINIFTFFENLKETFKFGLLVAMSRALSPLPPHRAPGQN